MIFSASLDIPYCQQKTYFQKKKEWLATKPNWGDDHDAYCRWLIRQDPEFFKNNLPFLGYVQIRIEGGFLSDNPIKSIKVYGDWCVSGLTFPPKDGNYPISDRSRWNLNLQQ